MRIVAVTACAGGIAHTYMAAEALEKVLKKKNGFSCKIETQGAMGPENVLSAKDIAEADVIIFCNMIALRNLERFQGYESKTVFVAPNKLLSNPNLALDVLREKGFIND